jgi:hypothetical protein
VPLAHVNAIEPYISKQVWTIIQLRLLTAARSGELAKMSLTDPDTTGHV